MLYERGYEYKMVGRSFIDGDCSVIHEGDDLSNFDEIFFSIYGRHENGEVECLADFHNKIDAKRITNELNDLLTKLKSFKIR